MWPVTLSKGIDNIGCGENGNNVDVSEALRLFGLAEDKKKGGKKGCNTHDGRRAGGGAGGGSETCTLIGPQRILVHGSTFSQIPSINTNLYATKQTFKL